MPPFWRGQIMSLNKKPFRGAKQYPSIHIILHSLEGPKISLNKAPNNTNNPNNTNTPSNTILHIHTMNLEA